MLTMQGLWHAHPCGISYFYFYIIYKIIAHANSQFFSAIDAETKRFASPSTTIFWCKSVDNVIQVEKVEVSSSMFTDWIRKKDHATLAGKNCGVAAYI